MSKKYKKSVLYAEKIGAAIQDMFNEDSEFFIDQNELGEGDNLTHFIHALGNVVPTAIFNNLTGDQKNQLEFNHTANQLLFQYMNFIDQEKGE